MDRTPRQGDRPVAQLSRFGKVAGAQCRGLAQYPLGIGSVFFVRNFWLCGLVQIHQIYHLLG